MNRLANASMLLIVISVCSCNHPDANTLKQSRPETKAFQDEKSTPPVYSVAQEVVEDSTISVTSSVPVESNSVTMERQNGVTYVWVGVNGIPLKFIFDTGASSIFISPAEALVLVKQGTLNDHDILGEENYQDATGGISVGTIINLREVKIGNKVLKNVKASVSDNIESPLLLGQSALEQFGTITIDNKNNKIHLN